jgi:glycosyltransferase A (GT-A) superfamily protein (DUF2064 family)
LPGSPTVMVMPPWSGTEAMAAALGLERASELTALLHSRALAAAQAVALCSEPVAAEAVTPGVGAHGGDALTSSSETADSAAGGADLPAVLRAAADRVWSGSEDAGPLLLLWPDLPRWRPAHVEAALSDLADGCDLAIGPVFDGGFYLLGLARPLPSLLELDSETWQSPDAMALTLAVAARGGFEAGLLRAERALRTAGDVAAALADPMLDDGLRKLLS